MADKGRLAKKGYYKLANLDSKELKLFAYMKIIKFMKEFDENRHTDLLLAYLIEFSKTYKREFSEFIEVNKTHHLARREAILSNQDHCNISEIE
jgi:hypothetical protein